DERDVALALRRRAIGDAQVPVERVARLREHCGSVSPGAGRASANAFSVSAGRLGWRTSSVAGWTALAVGVGSLRAAVLVGDLADFVCNWLLSYPIVSFLVVAYEMSSRYVESGVVTGAGVVVLAFV